MNINKFQFAALLFVAVLFLAGCSSTPAAAPKTAAVNSALNSVTIDLIAQNTAFNLPTITVPHGAAVTINFSNKDSGMAHNFALYGDPKAMGTLIYRGAIITGPSTAVYTFTAPASQGTYFFRCDVHPTVMTGSFIVQ